MEAGPSIVSHAEPGGSTGSPAMLPKPLGGEAAQDSGRGTEPALHMGAATPEVGGWKWEVRGQAAHGRSFGGCRRGAGRSPAVSPPPRMQEAGSGRLEWRPPQVARMAAGGCCRARPVCRGAGSRPVAGGVWLGLAIVWPFRARAGRGAGRWSTAGAGGAVEGRRGMVILSAATRHTPGRHLR